jgi:hypothetical protein
MAIDESIALGVKPVQIESPLNQMSNVYALQNAAQSNQLNRMKMDEYKRGLAEDTQIKNALTKLNSTSPTYEQDRYNAYALKGVEGLKTLAAIKREEAQAATAGVETAGKKITNATAAQTFAKKSFEDIYARPDDNNLKALYDDAVDSKLYDANMLAGMKRRMENILSVPLGPVDPTTGRPDFSARRKAINDMQLEAKDRTPKPSNLATLQNELKDLPLNDPRRKAYDDAIRNETLNSELQTYETAVKQGFKGSLFDFKRQLAEAGRAPAQPAAPTITTIQDPTDPSKSINVDARVYKGGGLGSPGVIGTGIKEPVTGVNLSAKTIQQREAKYPTATASLKGHLTDTDNLVKDLTALSNHPGLDEITGLIGGRIPGATKNGRAAQALYDKIVAKGGFNELQKMRDNSVTGGALGNVSDTEGKRLEASFAGLDRRQDAGSVKLAAKAAIEQLNASKANIQDAYDLTYEYKGSRSAPAKPTAPAGKNPHANKTDAQIKKELGL